MRDRLGTRQKVWFPKPEFKASENRTDKARQGVSDGTLFHGLIAAS